MTQQSVPNYEVVPLRKDDITVCVIQSEVSPISADNLEPERQKKLEYVLQLIDMAQNLGRPKDLLVFHEFPLSGFEFWWNREQALRIAIDVPGPETARIGEKAKQYNCYIHIGCYGKQPDWPGHFHNMGMLIDPNGEVIYKRWKLHNAPGSGFSTTVYDVLDQYVERYGWDAVFPVARTDIGNIAILPELMEPEVARIFAMKGVEIMIRYTAGGAGKVTLNPWTYHGGQEHTFRNEPQTLCITNNFYGIYVNNSLPTISGLEFDLGSGGSGIIDCNGQLMAEASSVLDTKVEATLPMSAYRKRHSKPNFYRDLYLHFFNEECTAKFPPNLFRDSLPDSIKDAAGRYMKNIQW